MRVRQCCALPGTVGPSAAPAVPAVSATGEARWRFNASLAPPALRQALTAAAKGRPPTATRKATLHERFMRMVSTVRGGDANNDNGNNGNNGTNGRRSRRNSVDDHNPRVSISGTSGTSAASGGGGGGGGGGRWAIMAGFRRLLTFKSGGRHKSEAGEGGGTGGGGTGGGGYAPGLGDVVEGEDEGREVPKSMRRAGTRTEGQLNAAGGTTAGAKTPSRGTSAATSRSVTRGGEVGFSPRGVRTVVVREPPAAAAGALGGAGVGKIQRPKSAAARIFGRGAPSRAGSVPAGGHGDTAADRKHKAMLNFALAASALTEAAAVARQERGAGRAAGRRRSSESEGRLGRGRDGSETGEWEEERWGRGGGEEEGEGDDGGAGRRKGSGR